MSGFLSDLVAGAAIKRLTAVEASPQRSHQHEFNGVQPLRALFGEAKQTFQARFLYLSESDINPVSADGFVTWYDSREEHPTRSEFRLYYKDTDATSSLNEGDVAVVIRLRTDEVIVAVAAAGSTAEHQLLWLLGLLDSRGAVAVADLRKRDKQIGFAARSILQQLGVDPSADSVPDDSHLDVLLERFGDGFPRTDVFSAFARDLTDDCDPIEDPDGALMAWLEREEALFRALERHLVRDRLCAGFGEDVDAFVAFSLSVQNRRKSRVGRALEHHVRAILDANRISYSHGETTERASRPDFLFPSIAAYRDFCFPPDRLRMLAVKSTCKDRWRQILVEAERIAEKHLLTLEPGISVSQTDEMIAHRVCLVVPASVHATYLDSQRAQLQTVSGLLNIARDITA